MNLNNMGINGKALLEMEDNKISIQNKYKILFVGIVLNLILVFIFSKNIDNSYGIAIINDEFGYWGIAASLNGKNWSGLLENTPYYSFGYSLLIALLYRIFPSTQQIYQCALWINVLFISASFWLAFICGRKLISKCQPFVVLFISFLITLYSNNIVQSHIAWTETLLYFLFWLLIFSFVCILEKPSLTNVALFSIINVYMYYVHQRTLGIILSTILIMSLLVLSKKISKKNFVVFIAVFALFFAAGNIAKSDFIETLFTSKDLVAMNNFSGQTSKIKSIFTSTEGFILLIQSVLGKLFYFGAATYLVGYIALGEFIFDFFCGWRKIIQNKFKIVDNKTVLYSYLLLAFAATFLISAVAMYVPNGRLDLLIYGRYMEMTIGPFLLYGFYLIYKKKINEKTIIIYPVILIVLAWVVDSVYCTLNTTDINLISVVGVSYFFETSEQITGISFKIAFLVIAIFLFLLFLVRSNRKILIVCASFILSVLWIEMSEYTGLDGLQKSIQYNLEEPVDIINQMSEEYTIYAVESAADTDQYAKYLQYRLPDSSIQKIELSEVETVETPNSLFMTMIDDEKQWDFSDGFYILYKKNNLIFFTERNNLDLIEKWKSIKN